MSVNLRTPDNDPALKRALEAAGVPAAGTFRARSGWVSRAWVGDEIVVRVANSDFRGAYQHEARVIGLISESNVPHARLIAHGEGPDGYWYISERLPGTTLHEAWPDANTETRRSIIESLGDALRLLHQTPVPSDLKPPWLKAALNGGPRLAYHPPVIHAAPQLLEDAHRAGGHDPQLLASIQIWIDDRMSLFANDTFALVHGDLHGSNIIVNQGHVTGIIDFAEALAQPADVELDTFLRWCTRSTEYPPSPEAQGLHQDSLRSAPGWLRESYPELFASENLRERLLLYDLMRELALYAHHPQPEGRNVARHRLVDILAGHNHLDRIEY